jgi:NaMN:DMB phosphoribosyltransferase
MTQADTDRLIRQFSGGDAAATAGIVEQARTSQEPVLLVAAALIDPAAPDLLARATQWATNTRDRQLVAIAAAHLDGDHDRVDALARDHLVDHPDNILVAWIAGAPHHQEKS